LSAFGKFISSGFKIFNGEFFLDKKANGGGIIAARSIWTSILIFICSLALCELINPSKSFCFDLAELRRLAVNHFEWLGAIFVAVYVALYTRFSAQWSYLASLYNQIMQSRAEQAATLERGRPPLTDWALSLKLDRQEELYAKWMAAFISDALEMHLATKETFKACIHAMLALDGVKEAFLDGSPENQTLLDWFKKQ
jgi:hypothetical protein